MGLSPYNQRHFPWPWLSLGVLRCWLTDLLSPSAIHMLDCVIALCLHFLPYHMG